MTIHLLACTVCYGDPTAPISQGAVAGVLVMGGVIAGVAATFGGLFLFWMRRARELEAQLAMSRTPSTSIAPPAAPLPRTAPSEPPSLTLH